MPEALAASAGYVEQEFFLTGEATAYTEVGEWGTDGRWRVEPTTTAPYTTRVLVRRPADPARFDGTALVEWLNVSSGQDSEVEFAHAHDELLAHGTVWVGVSAQSVGIQGGGPAMAMPGLSATPLKTWDPDRYGPLVHPGDDYSYDIFSQVAAALVRPAGVDLLNGGRVGWVLAAGESQSAARMVTYVNAVHPVADIYDGFLIHSRSDGGAILHTGTTVKPPFALIRDDLDVPVFQFETETDLFGLPFISARQPDNHALRTWEVAGTAHLDQSMLDYFASAAAPTARERGGAAGSTPGSGGQPVSDPIAAACGPLNAGPQSAVVSKAIASLRSWIVDGTAPASGPPIEVVNGTVSRDEHGLALGGIRTPPVDAPTAALRGDGRAGASYVCSLFGSTTPFDQATLSALYPTHDSYVEAVTRSARTAVDRGHLRASDADAYIAAAERSAVGT